MLYNRCESIDPEARTQCGQEAFINFNEINHKMCKLHTAKFIHDFNTETMPLEILENVEFYQEDGKQEFESLINSVDNKELNNKINEIKEQLKAEEIGG